MYKNKEWMQEQLKTKTAQEIIKEFNIAETTFYRWIKKHNLTIKTHKLYENKEWLENECKIKTAEQIGQENNCDAATIRRWKRKFNITINPVPLYQDKEWLIEQLIIYKSAPKIAEAFGYNAYTVNDWILRHGLREEENHRLYQLNEDYFEIIDTERKAYFLGFLMADGFIDKNQKMFGIGLHPKDKYILEELAKELNYNGQIEDRYNGIKNKEEKVIAYKYLNICSSKMCKDLIYHGIVPRKSGKECVPDTIPQDLIRHFIRGFFDGDGWVSISSGLVFGLCGMSANIMIDIDDYFKNTINISGNLKRKDNYQVRFFNYNIYSNDAKKVFEHIYQDASIFLTRKKDKFDKYNK